MTRSRKPKPASPRRGGNPSGSNHRYPMLVWLVYLLRVWSLLAAVPGVYFFIVAMTTRGESQGYFILTFGLFVIAGFVCAVSELLRLLINAGTGSRPSAPPHLKEAAMRLMRVEYGESVGSVYPNIGGAGGSTMLGDTETLCDAWIDEHMEDPVEGWSPWVLPKSRRRGN